MLQTLCGEKMDDGLRLLAPLVTAALLEYAGGKLLQVVPYSVASVMPIRGPGDLVGRSATVYGVPECSAVVTGRPDQARDDDEERLPPPLRWPRITLLSGDGGGGETRRRGSQPGRPPLLRVVIWFRPGTE